MVKALMIQGTGSNVGKSLIVAGMARAFARRGLRVRPFKPQNMSNNAAVTQENGEIGRAQALQAQAAGIEPSVHMNPVLLKPESETGAQLILQGQRVSTETARAYWRRSRALLPTVLESFEVLSRDADLILVEGAGSPAETNLRANDIANMGFAQAAGVPVVLVGDIDRGGVIAQIVGTQAVLDEADATLIKGFIINRFRGDPTLFDEGFDDIVKRTSWAGLGVVPWFGAAHLLPAEDVLDLAAAPGGPCRVVVPKLPRIANFDDLDPLAAEPAVALEIVEPGRALPGDAALVILPGSKATIDDLAFLRAQGWDVDIAAHLRRGGHLVGLCGGYQMLGRSVADPDGIEGAPREVEGLGYLDVTTRLTPVKALARRRGTDMRTGAPVEGYEIHMGVTAGPDCARPWVTCDGRPDGACDATGRVRGAYLHGIFASDTFRKTFLAELGHTGDLAYAQTVEATLDALADHLETHLDLDKVLSLATRPTNVPDVS